MRDIDPDLIINSYSGWKLRQGWILVNRDDRGAQFSVPKRYSPLAFWVGLATFWIYGFGILIWILGGIDFIFSGSGPFYVDVRQMEKELRARKK